MRKKTMYSVYDNGKLAVLPLSSNWAIATYDNFDAAEDYCLKWLGIWAPDKGTIKPDTKFWYIGEDSIEIVTEKENENE